MSSFFTLPASQRKRKRTQPAHQKQNGNSRKARQADDESISGSDVDDDDGAARVEDGDVSDEDEDDEYADEDPASKRVRLAEQYLANTQKAVLEDGFDAADVDQENLRRRMGERLKHDTAESKGKLYKWIADGLDWRRAASKVLRHKSPVGIKTFTGVAVHGDYVYGVSKDLRLAKWKAPADEAKDRRPSKRWTVVATTQGKRKERNAQCHNKAILCVAVSPDGKFVATGGLDKKLIIWDGETLKPLKVFPQHRDAVTALAFRKGTNQLFSASKDRTIKIWSLNELAYVETLFGHQDEVVAISALAQEKCVTVGARDRTARLWKVVEESQLVFRGGGAPGTHKALASVRRAYEDDSGMEMQDEESYHEGSIDQVVMIDDDTFVTGSDNGSLALWNVNKKKALFTLPLAHGLDPPIPLEQASAEIEPDETLDPKTRGGKQPRYITALAAIPFSDVVVSGSWDGYVRVWRISQDKRRIEPLGAIGVVAENANTPLQEERPSSDAMSSGTLEAIENGVSSHRQIKGVINSLSIGEKGERGKESVFVAAATGQELRLGRWKEFNDATNCVVLFEVHKKASNVATEEDDEEDMPEGVNGVAEDEDFEGLD